MNAIVIDWLLLVGGLVLLIFSGDFLVKGAVGISKKFKVSPLIIGMTVVSFGTSAPELIVSVKAALLGSPDIALGNVIGSNIANISLVLGITAIVFPIVVDKNSKRVDYPFMLFSTLLLFWFMQDLVISRGEGVFMFLSLCTFISYIIYQSRKHHKSVELDEEFKTDVTLFKSLLFLIIGCIGLYFGSELLLEGAVNISLFLGLEESLIGVTIIAFGTSVPELATSVIAAYRKETDISIGNLIGSNIFNIMTVLGITSIISPIKVNLGLLNFDYLWVISISILLGLCLYIGKNINRTKGFILTLVYLMFTFFVVFNSLG